MNYEEKQELEKIVYSISNSELPLNDFLNDIKRTTNPNYNKEQAYIDFKKLLI